MEEVGTLPLPNLKCSYWTNQALVEVTLLQPTAALSAASPTAKATVLTIIAMLGKKSSAANMPKLAEVTAVELLVILKAKADSKP